MSRLFHPLPFDARASAKASKHRGTAGTCRERATADLLKSVAMITDNERLTLERSAGSRELRAQLLDRVESKQARSPTASQGLGA
jgi:hypothetical protein